jgi:hypothetical protein
MDNVLLAKSPRPDDRILAQALGDSFRLWRKIRESLEATAGPLEPEWKYYGAKLGWTMKVLSGKRNLFFLTAGDGRFRIGFVFGDRAVAALGEAGLPPKIVEEVEVARRYAEGRGLRLEVKSEHDAALVLKLAAVKIRH